MAFGVAFSIKGNLGTSPISSVPYVLSKISLLTVGTVTILMHCVFVLLQILILRKKYQLIQLTQLVAAIIFGYMTDFAIWTTHNVTYSGYLQQWVLCVIGILLVGIGVSCEVTAGVVTVAGEGLVIAITKVFPIKFGNMKIIFDITLVVIACGLSYIFLRGLYGVREGTLAATIFVGMTAKAMKKPMNNIENKYIKAK